MTNLKKMTVNMMSLFSLGPKRNNEQFNNEKVFNEIIHLNVVFSGAFKPAIYFCIYILSHQTIQIIIWFSFRPLFSIVLYMWKL